MTAVDWLIKELKDFGYYTYNLEKLCEQAKEMEKQQGYSEEEVLDMLKSLTFDIIDEGNEQFVEEWFEQRKKKKTYERN